MYCTNCGHPLKPGASFCTECGEPVPKENYTPKAGKEIKLSVSKKQRTRKRVLLWIVFPAALLILFVLLVNNPVENTKAIVFDSYGDLPIGEAADKYLKNVKWDSEKNSDGSYTVTIRGTYPELNARIGVDFHYTEDEEYRGIVMSDWVSGNINKPDDKYPGAVASGAVQAGNDIMMPGTPGHQADILAALKGEAAYKVTRADLERCAARMIALAWRLGK